jgi:hypothetical protein
MKQKEKHVKKHTIIAALLLTASSLSMAASPQPLPSDPPYVMLFAPVTTVVVLGYSLTGQGAVLCEKMGGKWEPLAEGNNCPGGRWAKFYGLI